MPIPDMTLPQIVFGTIVFGGFAAFIVALAGVQLYVGGKT